MTQRIIITGGSGGAGAFVIRDLVEQGHACKNLDVRPPRQADCPFQLVDLTDYRAVHAAMAGAEALVHFAGFPHPDRDHWGAAASFANNTVALFNAFTAAQAQGVRRIVWASSETIYGFPFEACRPAGIPLIETSPHQPQNGYALSKSASETLAREFAALHGMTIIGLRLSNVLYDDHSVEPSYQKIPGYWQDLSHRKFNLWGYIDARDAARAVRVALSAPIAGAEVFNIAARDTIMRQDSKALLDAVFPGVPIHASHMGRDAMTDCTKAERLLGFVPQYTWADVIGANGERA